MLATTHNWLELLPSLPDPASKEQRKEKEKGDGPIERCLVRESEVGWELIQVVRRDLELVRQVCQGAQKHSNHSRMLVECISKGVLPRHWRRYVAPPSLSLNLWVVDLARRMGALPPPSPPPSTIWLGGLFNPNAFITATRQAAARANGWSVENMELTIQVLSSTSPRPEASIASFIVKGLTLEAAGWQDGKLALTTDLTTNLPEVLFSWQNKEQRGTVTSTESVSLPVYINSERTEYLLALEFPAPTSVPRVTWYQRGVAVVCQQW